MPQENTPTLPSCPSNDIETLYKQLENSINNEIGNFHSYLDHAMSLVIVASSVNNLGTISYVYEMLTKVRDKAKNENHQTFFDLLCAVRTTGIALKIIGEKQNHFLV